MTTTNAIKSETEISSLDKTQSSTCSNNIGMQQQLINNNGNNSLEMNTSPTPNHNQNNNNNNNNNANTPSSASSTHSARPMQSDEDFNIRFVNLVRVHRCLYDKKVPEYRNRDNQEKSWALISQETQESVIHCKERWRNLRACLSRYIKQQNSNDPQHKPYYLTEHMAFLLPYLKSTRNSLDGNNSLAQLFQYSQQQTAASSLGTGGGGSLQVSSHFSSNALGGNTQKLELKHSLSDNDDEETIDAFDPAVTANLQRLQNGHCSPAPSDTASANTMQNFIPDVQLAELRTPEVTRDFPHDPKRIKTECDGGSMSHLQHFYGGGSNGGLTENSDMEFFRSILPDIANLTKKQKRKFKIGILELIDDVVDKYPVEKNSTKNEELRACTNGGIGSSRQRRNSGRNEWRK